MFAVSGAERYIPEGGGDTTIFFARVVDVILDGSHPEFDNYGKTTGINGVFYRALDSTESEDDNSKLFAYQGNSTFKTVPLKNEIVMIIDMPTWNRAGDATAKVAHWVSIAPLWNHPHHNAYPDTIQYENQSDNADLGKDFSEQAAINKMHLSPGDTLIEGRYGNHIRLGGTVSDNNDISTDEDNGKPYMVLSNGQIETQDGIDSVKENIDEDSTSIYLTQDHQLPLTQANYKKEGYVSGDEPETADAYKGAQAIINSNRIFLNAKEDAVLISSLESVGVNTKKVAIDGEDYVGIDANKVYLGALGKREDEPVLLGQTTVEWLEDLHSKVDSIIQTFATMPPAPPAAVGKMIAIGSTLKPQMVPLKKRLELLKSKKVFTE